MARTTVKKDSVKSVNYLNKDFNDFKGNLIEYAKQYFPNTYNDFNEASPGMMFFRITLMLNLENLYYLMLKKKEMYII